MYTLDAINKYGVLVGSAMGAARILRCNPFAKGGFDPVKENFRGNAKWTL
jgi:putative component of membrane protein insertase Oxa1/YidC/SpoIIIJ protein YidD